MAANIGWIYHLSKESLLEELQLYKQDTEGNKRELQLRFSDFLKSQEPDEIAASRARRHQELSDKLPAAAENNLLDLPIDDRNSQSPVMYNVTRDTGDVNRCNVKLCLDIFRGIPVIDGSDPDRMLDFLVKVQRTHELALVDDGTFICGVMSRTSLGVLDVCGKGYRENWGWPRLRENLVRVFIPRRIQDDLVQSHITRRFQLQDENFSTFIKSVQQANFILKYVPDEKTLVELIIQNMLPSIRSYLVFSNPPQSMAELEALSDVIANAMITDRQRLAANNRGQGQVNTEVRSRGSSDRCPGGNGFQSRNSVQGPRRQRECWTCGRNDHFQRNCPARQRGSGSDTALHQGNLTKRNDVQPIGASVNVVTARHQLLVSSPRDPWVEVDWGGLQVLSLFDTGSVCSLINDRVYQALKERQVILQEEEATDRCHTANGENLEGSVIVKCHIKILGFSWDYSFRVVPSLIIPCILGNDFIKHARVELCPWKGTFRFGFKMGQEFNFKTVAEVRGRPVNYFQGEIEERQYICGEVAQPGDLGNYGHLVDEFPELFADRLGTVKGRMCHIELTDNLPVRSPPYQCSPPKLQQLREHVDLLLQKGVIRPSNSNYASPAFLVPKPNGKYRMVVNYQKLNSKIKFDCFPLPTIEGAFQHFSGAKIFSVIDLNMAYHQVPLSPQSRQYTAFVTPFGLYEFNKLPMGISVGSQVLSREMDRVFGDVKMKFVFNYADDVLVYSDSVEQHEEHLREVFRRLQHAGFTVNKSKITLGSPQIKFLGHRLSDRGIAVDPGYVAAVENFPRPRNVKQVRRFLGLGGFYAKFIPRFAEIVTPLNELKKKGVRFSWGEDQEKAFVGIKSLLCQAPTLRLPDFNRRFVLQSDASDVAISAILNQEEEGHLAPIAYSSRKLSSLEKRYSIYEREALAVVYGCEKFRCFLEHKEFVVHTDSEALSWLRKRPHQLGRIGRWVMRLSPFKFSLVHVRGTLNAAADALSRMFGFDEVGEVIEEGSRVAVLTQFPASFQSLRSHQDADEECRALLEKVRQGDAYVRQFQVK